MIEVAPDGAFVRIDAMWRNFVKGDSPQFPTEKDRYHLYVAGKLASCIASQVVVRLLVRSVY